MTEPLLRPTKLVVRILTTYTTAEAAAILTAAVRILDDNPRTVLAPILSPAELATVDRFGIHDIDIHSDRADRREANTPSSDTDLPTTQTKPGERNTDTDNTDEEPPTP